MEYTQNRNKTSLRNEKYNNLDVAKFIMSLLVVMIHTRPFKMMSPAVDFLVSDVVARIAVPIFFTISGFLFFRKLEYTGGKIKRCAGNQNQLLRFLKRNTIIYVLWSGVYIAYSLPSWYEIGWWGLPAIKDCVASLLFSGSYYHTWFLLSLIYAVPMLYVLLMGCPKEKLPLIICVGWAIECLLYSYSWVGIACIPLIEWLQSHIPIAFDAVFRALPLLGLGVLLIAPVSECDGKRDRIWCICFLTLCALEAILLKVFSPNQTNFSYLISTPFMAYYSVKILLMSPQVDFPKKTVEIFRGQSLLIYCLHPLAIQILTNLGMNDSLLMWLTVTALSVATSLILTSLFLKGRKITNENDHK